MGLVFLIVVLFFRCTNSGDSILTNNIDGNNNIPSNSYVFKYQDNKINYFYSENSLTHDYSNNWDLDGDGILDKIMFVGNDGAHIYYRILIHLSSIDNFFFYPYLSTDMPMYEPIDLLRKNDDSMFPVFVVHDFNKDGKEDIYLNISKNNYDSLKMIELGISSSQIVLIYDEERKEFIIDDYIKQF
jgi:hypothetical protein